MNRDGFRGLHDRIPDLGEPIPDSPVAMLDMYGRLRSRLSDPVKTPEGWAQAKQTELQRTHGVCWFQLDDAVSELRRCLATLQHHATDRMYEGEEPWHFLNRLYRRWS